MGEKRGRGRPRKEIKYTFPTDLDEVVEDEEFKQLIGEDTSKTETIEVETKVQTSSTDDEFDDDYDVFKSNIRNILSGREISTKSYSNDTTSSNLNVSTISNSEKVDDLDNENEFDKENQQELSAEYGDTQTENVKRGRGRPRKEVDPNEIIEVGEKRGRGRPRKIVDETEIVDEGEKRGRGRPKKIVIEQVEIKREERPTTPAVSSLTRSLSPTSMSAHGTQDIVFASKNVTTTNININVTKTSSSVDDGVVNKGYSNTTITSTKHKVELEQNANDVDDEIDVDYIKEMQQDEKLNETNNVEQDNSNDNIDDIKLDNSSNTFGYVDDEDYEIDEDDDEYDDEDDDIVEDKAPNGIADLLKALLDD